MFNIEAWYIVYIWNIFSILDCLIYNDDGVFQWTGKKNNSSYAYT